MEREKSKNLYKLYIFIDKTCIKYEARVHGQLALPAGVGRNRGVAQHKHGVGDAEDRLPPSNASCTSSWIASCYGFL